MRWSRVTFVILSLLLAAGWVSLLIPVGDAALTGADDDGRIQQHTLSPQAPSEDMLISGTQTTSWLGEGAHQFGEERLGGDVVEVETGAWVIGESWMNERDPVRQSWMVETADEQLWSESITWIELSPADGSGPGWSACSHAVERWVADDDGALGGAHTG